MTETSERAVLPPRRPPLSLGERVDPGHTAAIFIDMQNDFCAPGGAAMRTGLEVAPLRAVFPAVARIQETARAAGVPLIHVRNAYNAPGNPYLSQAWLDQARRRWNGRYVEVPICVPGTWGAEICPEMAPKDGEIVVTKHRFSAFAHTDLAMVLQSRGIRTLVVAGVVSYVCVESTVRDAFFANYHVVVCSDAVAGWHPEWHRHSVEMMDMWFGEAVPSARVLDAWPRVGAVAEPAMAVR
jgi:ureidoacrylate peracid hydrolase